MKILGIIGWKNSGKTFFVQEIIKNLTRNGKKVSSIKRAHHNFEIDLPNTDSYLHRKAGSQQVIISSQKRWAKITEVENNKEKSLEELLSQISLNTDFVIIEGFKNEKHPKIEIITDTNKDFLFDIVPNVVAIVSDEKINTKLPQFKKINIDLIINFILKYFDE